MDLSTTRNSPVVDYTSGDFDSFKESMQAFAQEKYSGVWTDFNESQIGVVLLEALAYGYDLLNYQLNASLRELFIPTVLRRNNLANLAKPLDYEMFWQTSARANITAELDSGGTYPFTINTTDNIFSNGDSEGDEVFFTPENPITVNSYSSTVTIPCIEGERWTNQLIGVSTGLAHQKWQIPQDGAVPNSIVVTVGAEVWEKAERNNLGYATSTDKVYRVLTTDEGQTFIVFGGDSYGQVPANGTNIYATFRVGGGKRGNLARTTIENIVSSHSNILSVTNPEKASGGDNPQSMRAAKAAIPASLRVLERAVTAKDHADLALAVPGVAKAIATSGLPLGSRNVAITIAPVSGGQPSDLLKADVATALQDKKMVTSRIQLYGPTYRNIRLNVLLHVNKNFRATDVEQRVRQSLINNQGTGFLDFDQLNFGAVQTTSDGTKELLLAQTRIQGFFDKLVSYGLERAEILQLDVAPMAAIRSEGNAGNGTIEDSSILLSGTQRRREYVAFLTSSNTYDVYEYIIGKVSNLNSNILIDETKTFEEEASSFTGYKLIPLRGSSTEVFISGASGQEITIVDGSPSLYVLTSVNSPYALYNPNPTSLLVGQEYVSSDGSVRFTLNSGMSPFIRGDYFTISIFPLIGDIELAENEYPKLEVANFTSRTSGGAKT